MPEDPGPDAIRKLPLQYGSWRTLKTLYKRLEADPGADTARLGALIARLDTAQADPYATPKPLEFKGARYAPMIATSGGSSLWLIGGDGWNEKKLIAYSLNAETLKVERLGQAEPGSDIQQLAACGRFAVTSESGPKGTWLLAWEVRDGKEVKRIAAEKLLVSELLGMVSVGPLICVLSSAALIVYTLDDGGAFVRKSSLAVSGFDKLWPGVGGVVLHATGRGLSLKGLARPEGIAFIDLTDPTQPALGEVAALKGVHVAVGGPGFVVALAQGRGYTRVGHVYLREGSQLRATGTCDVGYISGDISSLSLGRRALFGGSYDSQCIFVDSQGKPKAERWRVRPAGALCSAESLLIAAGNWSGGRIWQQPAGYPDARPVLLGGAPSAATIGYMKRRTRRLLKILAKSSPEKYVALAHATLKASVGFDVTLNWALAEIIYGGGGRLTQGGHGRGGLKIAPGPKLNLRRREELCPKAWDARPDLSETIYTDPKAGWGAREMVARQLRVAKKTLPDVPDAALVADLGSPSPLLQALAVRVVVQKVESGASVSSELLGHAWFGAGRARRETLTAALTNPRNQSELARALASHLSDNPKTARELAALKLLAERFVGPATQVVQPGWIAALLDGGGALRALALARLSSLKPDDVDSWLGAIEAATDPEGRELALDALAQVMRLARQNNAWWWRWRLIQVPSGFLRAAYWRFLTLHSTRTEVAPLVWRELLGLNSLTDALRTAMTSPHALALLTEFIPTEEFQQALANRPFLVEALDATTFKSLSQTLPLDAVLRLSAAASDESWARLRGGLLQNLTEGIRLLAFWQAVEQALSEPGSEALEARLLQSDDFISTFLALEDAESVLAIRSVAFGPLLGRWAQRNQTQISESERLRLLAATHPLGEVRAIGVTEVEKRPLTTAFALHLLESEVPDAVRLGGNFFDELTPGSPDEYGAALALCDSPARSVQARGRAFVSARKETLPNDRVLLALREHDDPEMQDFVVTTGATTDAPGFDAAVLQTRRRARRAKEKIKTRQEARPTLATDDLLALARQKSSPRDAEWALSQLVRRALSGETIEGLEIAK